MSERRPLMAANWKMHKTIEQTEAFLEQLLPAVEPRREVDVVICPPFLSLDRAAELTRTTPVRIAAQNMHDEAEGPYTGEVSAPMLREIGVGGAVLGHSERRTLFGETDEALSRKVPAALDSGLIPILCVGESEAQRERDETERVLRTQVQRGLEHVEEGLLGELVLAYEPVWAIGTGHSASPAQAQEAISFVRALVAGRSEQAGRRIRVLYGGSVKPANVDELMAQPDIDGALVGGASLDPVEFAALVHAAA